MLGEVREVGESFNVEFVVTGELAGDVGKIVTNSVEYTIIGVIEDGDTPLVYVPITDIKQAGVDKYSLVKVVSSSEQALSDARNIVELSGFRTVAIIDTVNQIEALFTNFRYFLIVIGMIALSIASLGMFNTLTVSLLERTREVGLMKAIGMSSEEIERLFIAESVSMGLLGGFTGLSISFVLGKLISLILSLIAITRGFAPLDVTYLPLELIVTILILSGIVGIITGYFPSKRATEISALNALRYE